MASGTQLLLPINNRMLYILLMMYSPKKILAILVSRLPFAILATASACPSIAQTPDKPASPLPNSYDGATPEVEGPFYEDDAPEFETGAATRDDSAGLFSLGIDFDNGLGVDMAYTHFYNRYFASEYRLHYFYGSDPDLQDKTRFYGADLTLILFLRSTLIVTPYLGLGPGYENFHKERGGVVFAEGQTAVANYTYGLNLNLGRHLVLQIGQRVTSYLGDAPLESPQSKVKQGQRKQLIVRLVVQI